MFFLTSWVCSWQLVTLHFLGMRLTVGDITLLGYAADSWWHYTSWVCSWQSVTLHFLGMQLTVGDITLLGYAADSWWHYTSYYMPSPSTASRLWCLMTGRAGRSEVRTTVRATDLFFTPVETRSEARSHYCAKSTGEFSRGKAAGAWLWRPPPQSSVQVKYE